MSKLQTNPNSKVINAVKTVNKHKGYWHKVTTAVKKTVALIPFTLVCSPQNNLAESHCQLQNRG
jgi:hypothetical protein